jgi:hypothetical protein
MRREDVLVTILRGDGLSVQLLMDGMLLERSYSPEFALMKQFEKMALEFCQAARDSRENTDDES